MFYKYKKFGIIANLALITNLILLMGILTILEATLTLPGIAGIILTVGMAVDANVLIFERIKEELPKNSKLMLSVKNGFDKEIVYEIISLVDKNEYKRRQAAPGIKITERAFGKDRRYPISSGYIENK